MLSQLALASISTGALATSRDRCGWRFHWTGLGNAAPNLKRSLPPRARTEGHRTRTFEDTKDQSSLSRNAITSYYGNRSKSLPEYLKLHLAAHGSSGRYG